MYHIISVLLLLAGFLCVLLPSPIRKRLTLTNSAATVVRVFGILCLLAGCALLYAVLSGAVSFPLHR